MKVVNEFNYTDGEMAVNIYTCYMNNTQAEYYSNIMFLYKCKDFPDGYECTESWLLDNFNCTTIDEAIEYTHSREYQFLINNGYEDYSQEFGKCYRYDCTFINDNIVVVEEKIYLDV